MRGFGAVLLLVDLVPAVARDRASRALTGVLPTHQVHVYPVTIEIHPREGERRRPGQLLL